MGEFDPGFVGGEGIEEGIGLITLIVGDGATQNAKPEGFETCAGVRFSLRDEFGDVGGAGADEVAVDEEERLRGDGRFSAFSGDLRGLGEVEDIAQACGAGLRGGADDGLVDRALELLDGARLFEAERGRVHCAGIEAADVLRKLEWKRRAAAGRYQTTADGEHGVSDGFGIEARAIHACEQTIFVRGRGLARLAIGA